MQAAAVLDLHAELPAREATPDTSINVLPLDFDWASLDENAVAGLDFLRGALRKHFVVPAVQTESAPDFWKLWGDTSFRVLDIVNSMATLVHEATSDAGPPRVVQARLVRGDRHVADELVTKMEHSGWADFAHRLSEVNVLISRARGCVAEYVAPDAWMPIDILLLYRNGNLLWVVGMELVTECIGEWLPNHQPRMDRLDDCSRFAEDAARLAGVASLQLCDVDFRGQDLDLWKSLLGRVETVSFLLEATRRVRDCFGPSTTMTINQFLDPDSDDPGVAHFVIETDLDPVQACDRFDEFCEEWWDSAAAGLDIVIHPVLDVPR